MAIVFGWYSFPIKKFSSTDLNIDLPDVDPVNFEIRQQIFHLFWIPVFPLYKIYGIRRDKLLYEVTPSIERVLKGQSFRTPWYSFMLPILLLLGFGGFHVMEEFSHYQYRRLAEQRVTENHDRLQAKIDGLKEGDLVRMYTRNWSSSSQNLSLYVLNVMDSNAMCVLVNDVNSSYSFVDILDQIENSEGLQRAFSIPIDSLRKSVVINEKEEIQGALAFEGIPDYYILNDIIPIQGPLLENPGTGSTQYPGLILHFQNKGKPLVLLSSEITKGNFTWADTFPRLIPSAETHSSYISLSSNDYPNDTPYAFTLLVEDDKKVRYTYLFEGTNTERKMRLIP